ncbi:hypothetical protein [Tenggerimyces flavus]|uniref:Uncharacterized protein n=1 Tax=Tenggerimyces flavus TaxID=1708749 RepID=A0ABV7Y4T5_9ACTN|nr:hypothetical protein [Tenggerimyces flavus]MBM7791261.1 hypothetical protein [Tenggerimyces flavus]
MGTSRLRVVAALTTCAALVVLTACGGGNQPTTTDQPNQPNQPGNPTTQSEAVARYGLPAVKDPKTTYQPDVVFIDNGPEAIRSVAPNGLVWTLDAGARGVSDLEPGKIMFASQRAVGRVMDVRKNGGDVQVDLAPVLVNEIVKDGVIKVDSPLDLNAMTFDASPEAPGAFTDLSKSATASPTPTSPRSRQLPERITLPALRPAAMVQGGLPLRAPNTSSAKVTLGNWEAQLKKDNPNEVSLQLLRSGKLGGETVRGGITVKLKWSNPHVQVNMPISNGQVSKSSSYSLSGLEAISGGWEFGGLEQSKGRLEIPIDAPFGPAFAGGVPVSAVIKAKAIVTFGITSKKSVVTGQITHPISGPIGTGSAPKASTLGKLLDEVHNVAVGPLGVVFAFEFKVIVGVGLPQFISGIYGKMVVSWGMTHSGGLGVAMCDSAVVNISFSAGIGANVSANILKDFPGSLDHVLTKRARELWEKWKSGFDVEQSLLNSGDLLVAEEYEPKIAACKP